jgi:hypothetical protein
MKYLVVKGWLGFGDRLESLKMCVAYAQHFNLQVYVDWTDSTWSHGTESFYTYFKLLMPSLNSLDDIPANATYHPAFWKGNIKTPMSQELVNRNSELKLDLGILVKSPYDADVIVCSSIGKRAIFTDSTFFGKIFRITDPRIRNAVLDRQRKHPLYKSIGYHIRGTDRTKGQVHRERSIQLIALNAVMYGGFSGVPMITVSDDKESLLVWKRFFPDTKIFSSVSLENTSNKGNHHIIKNDLKISKDELNVDMLVDFFTLASCDRILSTFRDSRFAREAERLSPHIKMILGNE